VSARYQYTARRSWKKKPDACILIMSGIGIVFVAPLAGLMLISDFRPRLKRLSSAKRPTG